MGRNECGVTARKSSGSRYVPEFQIPQWGEFGRCGNCLMPREMNQGPNIARCCASVVGIARRSGNSTSARNFCVVTLRSLWELRDAMGTQQAPGIFAGGMCDHFWNFWRLWKSKNRPEYLRADFGSLRQLRDGPRMKQIAGIFEGRPIDHFSDCAGRRKLKDREVLFRK